MDTTVGIAFLRGENDTGIKIMTQQPELLPCPFCGATAGDIKLSRGHGYIVGCGMCQGQQFAMSRDEAVKLWNTRTHSPAQAEWLQERMKEFVAKETYRADPTVELSVPRMHLQWFTQWLERKQQS